MARSDELVGPADRVALLRLGIVVVAAEAGPAGGRVAATGASEAQVRELVASRLGDGIDVDVLGELPRRLESRRCVGYMEREPGRLQLRLGLYGDEHVDEIVVAEDERAVVVFATVCTSAHNELGVVCERPFHVYLERPLADRTVIDGTCGSAVPRRNVYVRLANS
jgi:hypothetical protein